MLDTLARLDKPLALILILIMMTGLVALASATWQGGAEPFKRQLVWSMLGLSVIVLILAVPMPFLQRGAQFHYGLGLLGLLLVLAVGQGPAGRWLILGPLRVQPSEIAKVTTLLMMVQWATHYHEQRMGQYLYWGLAAVAVLPALLVAVQPDLGTSLVFALMFVGLAFWLGLDLKWFVLWLIPLFGGLAGFYRPLYLASIFIILLVALFRRKFRRKGLLILVVVVICGWAAPRLWQSMPAYQKARITGFAASGADARGASYQVIQSKIAIGSGGFAGKGFGRGTQTQLRFLPEHHTDFIFSAFAEEFGFAGVALVFLLWVLLLWRCLRVAERHEMLFCRLLVWGCAVLWGGQILINVLMIVGWAPVTGLPLPFFSYGGSATMLNCLLSGLVLKCSAA